MTQRVRDVADEHGAGRAHRTAAARSWRLDVSASPPEDPARRDAHQRAESTRPSTPAGGTRPAIQLSSRCVWALTRPGSSATSPRSCARPRGRPRRPPIAAAMRPASAIARPSRRRSAARSIGRTQRRAERSLRRVRRALPRAGARSAPRSARRSSASPAGAVGARHGQLEHARHVALAEDRIAEHVVVHVAALRARSRRSRCCARPRTRPCSTRRRPRGRRSLRSSRCPCRWRRRRG